MAVISGETMAPEIFDRLCERSAGRITIALDLGKKSANFVGTSLSRMNARKGRDGHLMQDSKYAGAAEALFQSPDYYRLRAEFTDHMTRTSDAAKLKSHALQTIDDYHIYYHILCEALASEVIDRKVTHVLFTNIPHLGYDTALQHVARALGLPTLILTQSLFPNRLFSMTDPACIGLFPADANGPHFPIRRNEKTTWFYMKGSEQEQGEPGRISIKAIAELAFFLLRKRPIKALNPLYIGRLFNRMRRIYRGLPHWRDPFAEFFHEDALAYFEHLCELETQEIDLSGEFVYVPLQMQPEMTTSALGGKFLDQAYAIERLSALLPEGVRILVKENPKQGAYMRGPIFFHRLRRIPSVQFLPSYVDTHELTAKSRFVATVTGTVGWEAICQGKPVLVFGKAWYRALPGVVEYHPGLSYNDVADLTWDHAALETAAGNLLASSHEGIVDVTYAPMYPAFNKTDNIETVATVLEDLLAEQIRLSFCTEALPISGDHAENLRHAFNTPGHRPASPPNTLSSAKRSLPS